MNRFLLFLFCSTLFLSCSYSQETLVAETVEIAQPVVETYEDLNYILSIDSILKTRHNIRKRRLREFAKRDERQLFEMSKKYAFLSKIADYPKDKKMYAAYSAAFKYLSKWKKRGFYKNWNKAQKLRYS